MAEHVYLNVHSSKGGLTKALEVKLSIHYTSEEPSKALINPLLKFSLLGKADELEANAAACVPLPCKFILMGQATMIYAAPGTGKTLITLKIILEAIEEKALDPNRVFYINADDNSQGLATKVRIFQDYGAHMLAVGHRGLGVATVSETLASMAQNGTAKGALVVIDTLKKFTNLMDKKSSTEFAQVCRQFVVAGGTIVALGHTTKSANEDGTPRYQGTTDILEDFDAAYVGRLAKSSVKDFKGIVLTKIKSRGATPEAVAYGFSDEADCSYDAKLASVVPMDPDDLHLEDLIEEDVPSEGLIHFIANSILHQGDKGKMFIATMAAEASEVSIKKVVKAIEHYEGPDPEKHLWYYRTKGHGRRIYYLHRPEDV